MSYYSDLENGIYRTTDNNEMIRLIEDGLGSEGSRELAELMYAELREYITFDGEYLELVDEDGSHAVGTVNRPGKFEILDFFRFPVRAELQAQQLIR